MKWKLGLCRGYRVPLRGVMGDSFSRVLVAAWSSRCVWTADVSSLCPAHGTLQ